MKWFLEKTTKVLFASVGGWAGFLFVCFSTFEDAQNIKNSVLGNGWGESAKVSLLVDLVRHKFQWRKILK